MAAWHACSGAALVCNGSIFSSCPSLVTGVELGKHGNTVLSMREMSCGVFALPLPSGMPCSGGRGSRASSGVRKEGLLAAREALAAGQVETSEGRGRRRQRCRPQAVAALGARAEGVG